MKKFLMVVLTLSLVVFSASASKAVDGGQKELDFCKVVGMYMFMAYDNGYNFIHPSSVRDIYTQAGLDKTMKSGIVTIANSQYDVGRRGRMKGAMEVPEEAYAAALAGGCVQNGWYKQFAK